MFAAHTFGDGRGDAHHIVALARNGWRDDAAPLLEAIAAVAGGPRTLSAGGWSLEGAGDVPSPDPSLSAFGLRVVPRAAGPDAPSARQAIAVLLARAGLLLRVLDVAHRHLAGRMSGGIKTMRHQLVKDGFVRAHAVVDRVREEAPLILARGASPGPLHAELTEATCSAACLTGGHGMLRGGTHALEMLSLCLAALGGASEARE